MMKFKQLFVAVPAALVILGAGTAIAGKTVEEAGVLVCINDKWDEKEVEKGHKLVDYAGRCVGVPDDPSALKDTQDCTGKYEYMADGSWKGSGTCKRTFKGGDTLADTYEEGSHLKEYTYKTTGGTGKYQGASGGGTYTRDDLNDTLGGGRFKGTLVLP